jgi:Tol biopolymer transport system component
VTVVRKLVLSIAFLALPLAAVWSPFASPAQAGRVSPLSTSSPKGNGFLAFVTNADGNNEIYRMYTDASMKVDLTNDPSADTDPAWSPDGTKIAFASNRTGNYDIYVMNADGSGVAPLASSPADDTQPAWSPDGRKIAFTSMRDGNAEVYSVNVDGTGLKDFTNNPASDTDPAWSPDGVSLAFTSDRGGDEDVYVRSGTTVTDLTNHAGNDSEPAWSPDGSKIAFTSDRDGNDEIYVMDSTGANQVDLTNDPSSDTGPVFSPEDGTRIAFTSDREGHQKIYLLNYYAPTNLTYGLVTVSGKNKEVVGSWQPLVAGQPATWPIDHVVIIYMENHSFNDVLGDLCVVDARCVGSTTGQLHDGTTIPLARAPDIAPDVAHSGGAQEIAINGGQMNGFDLIDGCTPNTGYACYMQYQPDEIPTIASLARQYVISDATYQTYSVASFGSHISLVSSVLDGFTRGGFLQGGPPGPGWGCDSGKEQLWFPTVYATGTFQPTCIPQTDGSGPYQASPLPWVPTIMKRFDEAGLSWRLYAPQSNQGGYTWSICPVFAECFFTSESQNFVKNKQFVADVQGGNMPNLSVLIPITRNSTHNKKSMLAGDNWIADQVNAVMASPFWSSTAIFLTWDDCGCFYDPVPPPDGLGIRSPMVIVSPYARPGYTDSTTASYASLLSFIEHRWGLAPMGPDDATAYDYSGAFNFAQRPLAPTHFDTHPIPRWENEWMAKHPVDDEDPT